MGCTALITMSIVRVQGQSDGAATAERQLPNEETCQTLLALFNR